MLTIIGGILALYFLDPPWPYIIIAAMLAVDIAQIFIWLRLRNRRAVTGPESLIGAVGTAITDCRPTGRVRVRGDVWKARCIRGVDAGAKVTVLSIEGLELTVAPRSAAPSSVGSSRTGR